MDDNRVPSFSPEVLEHIRNGKVFSGGVRHRGIVKSLLPEDAEWISISVPLDNVFAQYERVFGSDEYRQTESDISQIIIFASGDPLFFGFANTVKRKLPDANIKLYPSFNSLQTLAHRLVMPYNDMRTVSLTGRPWHDFDCALIERAPKIGVLTDREHTPAAIAARMLEYGYQRYTMYVGEHLGNPEKERIRHMTLKEFTIQAISKGSDDVGKVHMQVEYDNQIYYGFGANTDIIAASVEAYIDCINKFKS